MVWSENITKKQCSEQIDDKLYKNNNGFLENELQTGTKKRRGKNGLETVKEVYVSIDLARSRRKRVSCPTAQDNKLAPDGKSFSTLAPSAQNQEYPNDYNEKCINSKSSETLLHSEYLDVIDTPVYQNRRSSHPCSSIKRCLPFKRLAGNDDDIHSASSSLALTDLSLSNEEAALYTFDHKDRNTNSCSMSRKNSGISLSQRMKDEEEQKNFPNGPPSSFLNTKSDIMRDTSLGSPDDDVEVTPFRVDDYGQSSYYPQNDVRIESRDDHKNITRRNKKDSMRSLGSRSLKEEYDSVVIRILQDGGEIVLEYPNNDLTDCKRSKEECVNMLPTQNSSTRRRSETVTASNMCARTASNEPARGLGVYRRRGSSCDSDSLSPNLTFELTSTIQKSEEDELEKDLIACIKANKESIGHLQQLISADGSEEENIYNNINEENRSRNGGDDKKGEKHIFDFANFINGQIWSKYSKIAERTTSDHDSINKILDNAPKSPQVTAPPIKIIKRLQLSKQDEIHVSPCQCALSLVGMIGLTPSFDVCTNDEESMFGTFLNILSSPPSDSKSAVLGGFLNFSIFGMGTYFNTDAKESAKKLDKCDDHGLDISDTSTTPLLRSKYDKRERNRQLSQSTTKKDIPKKSTNMVRTNSTSTAIEYLDMKINRSRIGKKMVRCTPAQTDFSNDGEDTIVDKSQQLRSHHAEQFGVRRDTRWDYESVGYHEVTLIRNHSKDNDGSNCGTSHAKEGYVDWEAVTIRCKNHDELDILVKSLKASSCATVVPFSSNPKDRLKKMNERETETVECVQTPIIKKISPKAHGGKGMDSLKGADDQTSELSSIVNGASSITSENDNEVLDSPSTNKGSDTNPQKCNEGEVKPGNQLIKKIPWDFNFNKKSYCELCDLHFTLLTRRHHCRKCERSCCSHCSSVLLVEGGGEKRYCNRCSADILRKQSEALHKRLRKRMAKKVLPGKVHPACHRLGVGMIGKLPHWKNYVSFSAERRPAVGRLTIEIVEAMALPSVDKVHGKVDPYVRATITGYDRDLRWYLREWLPSNRYSMCSGYCTSTVSPVWRGCGQSGGERLTLPVISTAGAVLRLEVLHYNVMTNARGKDSVLGIVEIPLSDLPNANMRHIAGLGVESSKHNSFGGYCDRWYRLLPVDPTKENLVMLSKPIASPHSKKPTDKDKVLPGNKFMKSLEEIGKRAQGLCIAPVEWFASAIKLDLPARRPEAICEEHKARSTIHVRIKLNASHAGDLLSHAWFPPVKPRPSVPPFDPQLMLNRIQQVVKLFTPYHKIFQFIEDVIKWKHETKICLQAYSIFAFHMIVLPHLVYLLHIYLFIFLGIRLKQMDAHVGDVRTDDDSSSDVHTDEDSSPYHNIRQAQSTDNKDNSESTESCASLDSTKYAEFGRSPSLGETLNLSEQVTSVPNKPGKRGKLNPKPRNPSSDIEEEEEEEEESVKLSKAITWLAKRFVHNKELDKLQFTLAEIGRDLKNVNSVWDGSNSLLTRTAIVCIILSFMLHFLVRRRVLWLSGASIWYFAQAPVCKLYARSFLGFWRGVAKTTRRQQLYDAEILEAAGLKPMSSKE